MCVKSHISCVSNTRPGSLDTLYWISLLFEHKWRSASSSPAVWSYVLKCKVHSKRWHIEGGQPQNIEFGDAFCCTLQRLLSYRLIAFGAVVSHAVLWTRSHETVSGSRTSVSNTNNREFDTTVHPSIRERKTCTPVHKNEQCSRKSMLILTYPNTSSHLLFEEMKQFVSWSDPISWTQFV